MQGCLYIGRRLSATAGALTAITLMAGALPCVAVAQGLVDPGYNLYQTVSPGTVFEGAPLAGVPLGTYDFGGSIGTQSVGNADTILERLAAASVASTPNTAAPIPVQLVALQLETAVPINFEGLGLDNYFVTLQSARGGPASDGTDTIDFTTPTSGTYSSALDVFFDVRKGALNGPIVASNDIVLSGAGNTWSDVAPSGAVLIDGADNLLNGVDITNDFWTGDVTQTGTGLVQELRNASAPVAGTPEPGSVALLGAGFVTLGAAWRRRRARK